MSITFSKVGDTKELLTESGAEIMTLVEKHDGKGLVKKAISFMGEHVATIWAVIGKQPASPVWTSERTEINP